MLDQLKELLGISDNEKDTILSFIIKRAENRVLSYCNIKVIPEPLEATLIAMCYDVYRQSYQNTGDGEVKSITRGDTSVSYKTPTELASDMIKNPHFLNDYALELKAYRKLRK